MPAVLLSSGGTYGHSASLSGRFCLKRPCWPFQQHIVWSETLGQCSQARLPTSHHSRVPPEKKPNCIIAFKNQHDVTELHLQV